MKFCSYNIFESYIQPQSKIQVKLLCLALKIRIISVFVAFVWMFLVIMKTNEDFAISHLKINITDQKYWLKYVEKYSAMNLDASSPQRGKLILILKSLSDKGLKLKRIAHKEIFLCNVYDIYGQATKQKPLFEPTLKMTFSHCHWPARGVKWQLSLLTLL